MFRILALFLLLPLAAACATTPAAAPRTAFSSDRISVEIVGAGPDVVLVPGLSSHPDVWRGTVAAVPGYRYHLVHVAGFAGKAPGANASGPVIEPVAAEIARYIREAGLERPAIVGHSLGGDWAMLVAARNPGLVSRVMVVDMLPFLGAMFAGPTATPETLRPMADQIRQSMLTQAGDARRRTIEQTIATMVRTESLRPVTVQQSLDSHPAVAAQAFSELVVSDFRPDLRNIRVPLTVLYVSPPSAPVQPAQMEQFYRLSYANAPHATLRRIADSYHFIMYDQPDVFRRELREFLAAR